MPWTERQQAMLQAMGLRLWGAPEVDQAAVAAVEAEAEAEAEFALATAATEAAVGLLAPAPARPVPVALAAAAAPALREPGVRGELAILDGSGLRAAVAACTACSLCESRTQTVFGAGHAQAQWLVVGDAPDEDEDRQGEPFAGAAGELLDRMLAALQLTRGTEGEAAPAQRVYVAPALKCRPPRSRNPTVDEFARCEPYLQRQIELLQPRIILAMGRFAVQALLRSDEPIGQLRGRLHSCQGVPVVVTFHPSYLLRSPHEKAKAWDDLCLAADTAASA